MHFFRRTRSGALAPLLVLALAARAAAGTDVVLDWNHALVQFFADAGAALPVHEQARAAAMTHLAIEQAILSARGPVRPIGAPDADLQIAAIAAAHAVAVHVLPGGAGRFDAVAAAQLRGFSEAPAMRDRALTVGRNAARVVLGKRELDRWTDSDPTGAARLALADPLVMTRGREAKSPWLDATPFVLRNAAQFSVDEPYWSTTGGELRPNAGLSRGKIFDGVDRSMSADGLQLWTASPVVVWNRIACDAIGRAGLDLAGRARVLALVNLAIADATLAALHWQFISGAWKSRTEDTWVPGTGGALAAEMTVTLDGTEQTISLRKETRRILTPPLRNYPSIAATVAGAAGTALTKALGGRASTLELIVTNHGESATAGWSRTYASVTAAARECAFVASLDGQHSREACVAGYYLGESVGNHVAKQAAAQRR